MNPSVKVAVLAGAKLPAAKKRAKHYEKMKRIITGLVAGFFCACQRADASDIIGAFTLQAIAPSDCQLVSSLPFWLTFCQVNLRRNIAFGAFSLKNRRMPLLTAGGIAHAKAGLKIVTNGNEQKLNRIVEINI